MRWIRCVASRWFDQLELKSSNIFIYSSVVGDHQPGISNRGDINTVPIEKRPFDNTRRDPFNPYSRQSSLVVRTTIRGMFRERKLVGLRRPVDLTLKLSGACSSSEHELGIGRASPTICWRSCGERFIKSSGVVERPFWAETVCLCLIKYSMNTTPFRRITNKY